MATIGHEQLHTDEEGQVSLRRRLWNGVACRRRRRSPQFGVGCQALQGKCARQYLRALLPPAAVCLGPCSAGHLNEVLRCSCFVLNRVLCQFVVKFVILRVRHNKRCSYSRFECLATFVGPHWECPMTVNSHNTHSDAHEPARRPRRLW